MNERHREKHLEARCFWKGKSLLSKHTCCAAVYSCSSPYQYERRSWNLKRDLSFWRFKNKYPRCEDTVCGRNAHFGNVWHAFAYSRRIWAELRKSKNFHASHLTTFSETCYGNVPTDKVTSLDVKSNFDCDRFFRTCLPKPPLRWRIGQIWT